MNLWKRIENLNKPAPTAGANVVIGKTPKVYPPGQAKYRIVGVWVRDDEGRRVENRDANVRVACKYGEFRKGDIIECDAEQAEVLQKSVVIEPIEE